MDDNQATIHGRHYHLPEKATSLLDERAREIHALEPGKADPTLIPVEVAMPAET